MKEIAPGRRPVRRLLLGAAAAAGYAALGARAQSLASKAAGNDKGWRLLVNEAVTGESSIFILTARYRTLADYISAQLRRPPIGVEPVVDIQRFLGLAKAPNKPELVFGKSVNQLAKLVRDDGYQPVVRRADPYKAAFIVAKDSPIKSFADLEKNRAKIITPDEFAATTAVARAELRRQKVTQVQLVHTRYQEAVAQQITNGFGQVGVVNPTIAKKWTEEGGRVLAETLPVVNWSVLASPLLSEAEVAQLRNALLASPPDVLKSVGVKQWAAAERKDYLALLEYTKE
ncbi:MAG TPA: PhnD/SsuA/transferrin family substrate-binding protein [Ramlibacter sp.]|nr:PhnD/SsuA/transferrin family substrate-binding protein [Ramlibacter sp.]